MAPTSTTTIPETKQQDKSVDSSTQAFNKNLALAVKNGAIVDPSLYGLKQPALVIPTETGQLEFRDYRLMPDTEQRCVTISETTNNITTAVTLCPGGKHIFLTSQLSPEPRSDHQPTAQPPPEATREPLANSPDKTPNSNSSSSFVPIETAIRRVLDKKGNSTEERTFQQLQGKSYDEAVAHAKDLNTKINEKEEEIGSEKCSRHEQVTVSSVTNSDEEKQTTLNQTQAETCDKTVKEVRDLQAQLAGTTDYLASLIAKEHGSNLDQKVDTSKTASEAKESDTKASTYDSLVKQASNTLAQLAVSGVTGASTEGEVAALFDTAKSREDLNSLTAALDLYLDAVKTNADLAARIDRSAITTLADHIAEVTDQQLLANLSLLPASAFLELKSDGLGSLSSSEIKSFWEKAIASVSDKRGEASNSSASLVSAAGVD